MAVADPSPGAERRFDVTSLGESLLRLSVGVGHNLAFATAFDVNVGGAESNVCAALSGLGRRTGWVSRLPDNPLGHLVLRRLRGWGVDVGSVVLSAQGRVGIYYAQLATPPLPTRVTYDRAASSFTELRSNEVAWDYLLDTRALHLTGITPALGPSCRDLTAEAMERAKERGVLVSFDVNYRARLWPAGDCADVLRPLMRGVDLLLCGKKDAMRLFGLPGGEDALLDGLQELTSAKHIVVSLGKEGSIARSGSRTMRQPAVPITPVDRIGAGDAFAAGVLDGVLDGNLDQGLIRGTALAALALSHYGDVVQANRQELAALGEGVGLDVLR